jgi:hypothetical protein
LCCSEHQFLSVSGWAQRQSDKDGVRGRLKALIRRIAATSVVHCKPDCGSGHSKIAEEKLAARFNEVIKSED